MTRVLLLRGLQLLFMYAMAVFFCEDGSGCENRSAALWLIFGCIIHKKGHHTCRGNVNSSGASAAR
jgi:hypothetical protein